MTRSVSINASALQDKGIDFKLSRENEHRQTPLSADELITAALTAVFNEWAAEYTRNVSARVVAEVAKDLSKLEAVAAAAGLEVSDVEDHKSKARK